MDELDFLALANELHQTHTSEAAYREIIQLSYYACFHRINPLAEHIGLPCLLDNVGMHKRLCHGLQEYGRNNNLYDKLPAPIARCFYRLGLMLDSARDQRVNAAYKLKEISFNQQHAEKQLEAAQKIIDLIGDIESQLQAENLLAEYFA